MDSKERIESLCGIIESLLLLIEDETAADVSGRNTKTP